MMAGILPAIFRLFTLSLYFCYASSALLVSLNHCHSTKFVFALKYPPAKRVDIFIISVNYTIKCNRKEKRNKKKEAKKEEVHINLW